MSAKIIDGEFVAEKIREPLIEEISMLRKKGIFPHVKAVQVGENVASHLYIQNQKKQCEAIGITYTVDELTADTREEALVEHIKRLNNDPHVTGIILQIPLPDGLDVKKVHRIIAPHKDVEGTNPANIGELVYGNKKRIVPCTAMAAVELIKSVGVEIRGKEATIVGRSAMVGKPVSLLLLDLSATPTICHSGTKDLSAQTKKADILVAAVGKAELIKGDMIKPGAIVIDVGINHVKEFDVQGNSVMSKNDKPKMKITGDVEFRTAKEVASYITPVPGGVEPVTMAILLRNTMEASKMSVNY
ncbi:MAG: bifunctional 5,10-methylenetetrahydrofolate dehydrogenase/5,10-methenyltetrahydrofolate cyclohydrolase [Candidatus Jettenia sp.]|nr:MAG: bifunctional 5,10-methylenetetrahydrofolate dehydrogenase/5,10-methenyltetrahydrofolate cyclohydrolase [Candidatus Jettenia sp.]